MAEGAEDSLIRDNNRQWTLCNRVEAEGLEWLYADPTASKNSANQLEEYLLGKSIEGARGELGREPIDQTAAGSLLADNAGGNAVDQALSKFREDPLFVIKKVELHQKQVMKKYESLARGSRTGGSGMNNDEGVRSRRGTSSMQSTRPTQSREVEDDRRYRSRERHRSRSRRRYHRRYSSRRSVSSSDSRSCSVRRYHGRYSSRRSVSRGSTRHRDTGNRKGGRRYSRDYSRSHRRYSSTESSSSEDSYSSYCSSSVSRRGRTRSRDHKRLRRRSSSGSQDSTSRSVSRGRTSQNRDYNHTKKNDSEPRPQENSEKKKMGPQVPRRCDPLKYAFGVTEDIMPPQAIQERAEMRRQEQEARKRLKQDLYAASDPNDRLEEMQSHGASHLKERLQQMEAHERSLLSEQQEQNTTGDYIATVKQHAFESAKMSERIRQRATRELLED